MGEGSAKRKCGRYGQTKQPRPSTLAPPDPPPRTVGVARQLGESIVPVLTSPTHPSPIARFTLLRLLHLGCPEDQVHARVGLDNVGHFADLELERRVLKRLLHLPSRKEAEVALGRVRRAVRLGRRWREERGAVKKWRGGQHRVTGLDRCELARPELWAAEGP